jgi:hypothetical protein
VVEDLAGLADLAYVQKRARDPTVERLMLCRRHRSFGHSECQQRVVPFVVRLCESTFEN